MTASRHCSRAAFTLVETLIGMSLALMVMTAVLTTYVTLGRNFTRTLGLSSANQPNLESQSRRTLATFAQDVRMASGLDLTGTAPKVVPSNSGLTLIIPTGSGTKYVTYYYNGTAAPAPLSTYTIPAYSLARIDLSTSTAQTLHTNLSITTGTASSPIITTEFYFRYFDSSGLPYDNGTSPYTATVTNYVPGIKQVSVSFASQAGSIVNGTLTQVYRTGSPRLLFRNKALLQ